MKMGKHGATWYIKINNVTFTFANSVDMWWFAKELVKGAKV